MGSLIGNILPEAIAVAISPLPIVAVILMLFSKKAKANSLAFLVGWIIGLAAVCAIVTALGSTQNMAPGSGASNASYGLKIILGLLLLFLAVRNWRKRPKPGEQPKMPAWMSSIDTLKPGKSVKHVETWQLFKNVPTVKTEADADKVARKLIK